MEYTPDAVLSRWPGLPEASSDANLRDLSAPTLVRSLGVGDFNVDGEWLILWAGRRRIPLPIRKTHMMACLSDQPASDAAAIARYTTCRLAPWHPACALNPFQAPPRSRGTRRAAWRRLRQDCGLRPFQAPPRSDRHVRSAA